MMSESLTCQLNGQGQKRVGLESETGVTNLAGCTASQKRCRTIPSIFLSAIMNRGLTSVAEIKPSVDKILIPKLSCKEEFQCRSGHKSSVFGIEFSKDGRTLLSSHRDRSLRGLDNRTHRVVWTKEKAHLNSCNGCTFIDEISFASYSDDKTVKVWDLRNTTKAIQTLTGHTGWVKNVCVVPGGKKLLTSGFDNSIRMFDISSSSEKIDSPPLMVFEDLCRMKLAPSGDFLLITTWRTNIYKILNLDLDNLKTDVDYYNAHSHARPFGKDRNNIKFVHYVPGLKDLVYGYSVDISADEFSCVVRHASPHNDLDPFAEMRNRSEWTSVYDLQMEKSKLVQMEDENEDFMDSRFTDEVPAESRNSPGLGPEPYPGGNSRERQIVRNDENEQSQGRRNELREKLLSAQLDRCLTRFTDHTRLRLNMLFHAWNDDDNWAKCRPQDLHDATFFREFDHSAPGIIKEAYFNTSGTLIVSPSRLGFQILSFDRDLNSYTNSFGSCGAHEPRIATELSLLRECFVYADSPCLCAKFSPWESMVVTGDDKGRIMWFRPWDSHENGALSL